MTKNETKDAVCFCALKWLDRSWKVLEGPGRFLKLKQKS